MELDLGIIVGLVVFFVLLAAGLPLCWVFLGSAVLILVLINSPFGFIAGTFYHALDNYILMAIACFIFAGGLMAEAGCAEHIVRLSYSLVGRFTGGLVDGCIVATLFLSALTGSSLPCIASLIPILVPQMEEYGIQRRYTTAVLCSSSFLGYLIPPSVPVLIYCALANQSVAAVFLCTVIPGILIALAYMVVNHLFVSKYTRPSEKACELPKTFSGSAKLVGVSTLHALPALGVPLLVLGIIYGGICTPNEAGALAIVYILIIGLFAYRKLKLKKLLKTSEGSLITIGMIFILMAFGVVFTRVLVREGVAQELAAFVLGMFQNKYAVLFMLNVFILILGMFIDGLPIQIIIVPLILPLVKVIGVNLVQLGAIVIVNIGIGVATPPYAVSIFAGSRLANVPYEQLVKPMLLFVLLGGLPVLFLTTYIPWISCWLPTLVMGQEVVGAW